MTAHLRPQPVGPSPGPRRLGWGLFLAGLLAAGGAGRLMGEEVARVIPDPLRPVPLARVTVTDPFWSARIEVARRSTLPACLDRCDETGRHAAFARAAGRQEGEHRGRPYDDSDVYKVIEGAALLLSGHRDPALEARLDRIIDTIAAAQQEDGYLNTFVTVNAPERRWQNIRGGHELYCAGHLIQAGLAYQQATGKQALLDVAVRFAGHIDREFGPGRRLDPPGHQEIELALFELADATGEDRYAALAAHFLRQRGSEEGRERFGPYCQDHRPVVEQREAVGHAVRLLYQSTAVAELARRSPETTEGQALRQALEHLWQDVTTGKMYVTGGVGSTAGNEGFGPPFHLPLDSAYCETCAAYGMVLWSHRMFLLSGQARYVEVLERALYNALLAGISLDGRRFFYDNPLASRGDARRQPWFECACCPTNLVRALPSVGGWILARRRDEVYQLLPMGVEAELTLSGQPVRLRQSSRYPWEGDVTLEVACSEPVSFALHLREPEWARGRVQVSVNGQAVSPEARSGFLPLPRRWENGDTVRMVLPMEPRRERADPRVAACRGRVALARGPLVYCLEAADNGGSARNLVLPPEAPVSSRWNADLLGGCVVLRMKGKALTSAGVRDRELRAVPYALWGNREPGEMVVWIPESEAQAQPPGEGLSVRVGSALLRASHCHRHDSLEALADGREPSSSGDHSIPRMTFWDHRGTREWVSCRTDEPRRVGAVEVYWFDDTGRGACRVPESWQLSWRDGETWRPVTPRDGESPGCAPDRYNRLRFEPVLTGELRLEVQLQAGYSAGILEWRIQ